jgi:hypothetical protein
MPPKQQNRDPTVQNTAEAYRTVKVYRFLGIPLLKVVEVHQHLRQHGRKGAPVYVSVA